MIIRSILRAKPALHLSARHPSYRLLQNQMPNLAINTRLPTMGFLNRFSLARGFSFDAIHKKMKPRMNYLRDLRKPKEKFERRCKPKRLKGLQ